MLKPTIDVHVRPEYLTEQSDPDACLYSFAYTIQIGNPGDAPAQLIARHWIITDALGHVEEVKGLAVIRGYRGMTKGDCAALAQAVAAFSQLAAFDDIAEAEINPLIVRKENEGVVAVDGLIVRR